MPRVIEGFQGGGLFFMGEVPLCRGALINRRRNLPRTTTRTYLYIHANCAFTGVPHLSENAPP